METRTALISPNAARLNAKPETSSSRKSRVGNEGKNTWGGSIWITLPGDFYHLSAICVRLQVSNINGVWFCFSGPTGRHYCTKEVIISIWVSASTTTPS